MKNTLYIIMILSVMLGIGCSSNKSTPVAAPPPEVTVPDVVDPGGPNGGGTGGGLSTSSGDVVTFVPTNLTLFNAYVGTHPINNPKDFKLSVNLTNAGGYKYAGTIKISYVDNGQTFEGSFEAGSGTNYSYNNGKDNGELEAKYNYWYNNGKVVFSGFFQDQFGSIVLVIDSSVDQGDGQGGGYVGGSIYFKNFAQSMATQSPYRKCWFIYDGPYDCRSTQVINKSSLYPTEAEGYRKLGTFSGMSKTRAFNL
jgi:hypothetical protein